MSLSSTVSAATAHRRGKVREAVSLRLDAVRVMLRGGVNYARNLKWIVARTVEGRGLRFAVVLGLGQLSLAAQAGALGLLYWYAGQAEADTVVSAGPLGVELRARESLLLLSAVVGLSGACLLGSSGLVYLSKRMVIGIAETDLARRLTDVVRIARRLPDPRAPQASHILLSSGLAKVSRGCVYAGATVITLVDAVTPLVGAVVASGVLFVLAPGLTSTLVVAAMLWCVLLYPLMKRQARVVDRRLRGHKAFMAESAALLRSPASAGLPDRMKSAVVMASTAIGRRHVANDIQMVLQSGTAVIGTGAALAIAYRIITGGGDWPIFIVYVGSMRIVLNGGFAVPRMFGTISRYYPRLVVCIQFLQDAVRLDREAAGRLDGGEAVTLGALPDGAPVVARGGDHVALASVDAPKMVQGAFLAARSTVSGPGLVADWVDLDGGCFEPRREEASIRLVDAAALAALDRQAAQALLDSLTDGVTAIVYRNENGVGAFGERLLFVVEDGALAASATLGTGESDAALASFAAARRAVVDAVGTPGAAAFDGPGAGEEEEE